VIAADCPLASSCSSSRAANSARRGGQAKNELEQSARRLCQISVGTGDKRVADQAARFPDFAASPLEKARGPR